MSSKTNEDITYIECPYCKVCTIALTNDEAEEIKSGQLMIEVCQVCGKEVRIDADAL